MPAEAQTTVVAPDAVQPRRSAPHDLALGAVAGGLLAGAAMLAFAAAASMRIGEPAARALQLTAATVLGAGALEGGPAAALAGLLLWGGVSVALALLYAAVVPRDFPFASAAMMGVGYAFVLIGIMSNLVLPALNPVMRGEMASMGGSWVIAYAIFGLVLGVIPRIRKWLAAP